MPASCERSLRFKLFLVFRSNLPPLRDSDVVLFNFKSGNPNFWRSLLQISAFEVKVNSFKCLLSKKEDGFQASLSYRRHHLGLVDDTLKV